MSTPQTTTVKLKFVADATALAKGLKEVTQATGQASKAEKDYQTALRERMRTGAGRTSQAEESHARYEDRRRADLAGRWRGQEATGSYGLRPEDERGGATRPGWRGRNEVGTYGVRGPVNRVRDMGSPVGGYRESGAVVYQRPGEAVHRPETRPGPKSDRDDDKPKEEPGFLKALIASRGGATGIAAAVAFGGAHSLRNYESTVTDPFTTRDQRVQTFARGVPVFGTGWRLGQDIMNEAGPGGAAIRAARERASVGQIMARGFAERSETEARMRPDEVEREERQRGYEGYSAARVPGGIDRTTGNGRVQYQEELKLLGLRDKATKATIEEGAARAKSLGVAKEQERVQSEIVSLTKRRDQAFGMAQKAERMGDQKGVEEYKGAAQGFDTRLTSAYNQNRTLEQEGAAARTAHAQAATGARQADLDLKRGRLSIGQAAEEEGSSHAKALSYMGQGGRLTGAMALQLVRQIGVEAAPPDLLAAARSIAPNEVDEMAERQGVGLAQGMRGTTSDIRNERAANLPNQRKQNDEDFEAVTAGGEYIDKAGVSMVTDALRGLLERTVGANMAAIAQEIQSMQLEAFARHAEAGR